VVDAQRRASAILQAAPDDYAVVAALLSEVHAMSHCATCRGGRWSDPAKPATPENWEACPGCNHEAELAALRKVAEAANHLVDVGWNGDVQPLCDALAAWEGGKCATTT
jgi:hypothetical protein